MPRRSPRSRSKPAPAPRLPGKARPRPTPGSRRDGSRRNGGAGATSRATRGQGTSRSSARSAPRADGTPQAQARHPKRATTDARRPAAARTTSRRGGRFTPPDPERVAAILAILDRTYPDAATALRFENPLQLLIATILSAQCTDARVNQVTPALFARWPDAAALSTAPLPDLEQMIHSTGFFRNKAKAIHACTTDIVALHGGEVPRTMEELTRLHGVGRKTANVVLGNAFGIPGLVVDTHVTRVAYRLGLTRERDPVKIEHALMAIVPRERWTVLAHWLILHGRAICVARKPRCSVCPLAPYCPRVGVTTSA